MPYNPQQEASKDICQGARCTLCHSTSRILYEKLTDRLYGSVGQWDIMQCKNPQCGLCWINPLPSPEELANAYQNYYTHLSKAEESWLRRIYRKLQSGYLASEYNYTDKGIGFWSKLGGNLLACLPHRRVAFDASVMWLSAMPGGNLLEIGCGSGDMLSRFANLGWQVQGVDPDKKNATQIRKRGLPVLEGKLEKDSFEPDSFDVIIMNHVIEHTDNAVKLLQICQNILKPDGRLIMLTPNLLSLGHRWFGKNWMPLDPPRHLSLFTEDAITTSCKLAGLKNIKCVTTFRDANNTFAGCMELARKNRYQFGNIPLYGKLIGLLLLYIEWIYLKYDNSAGEELLILARAR